MRVVTVVGARPQFVKSGPVSGALERAKIDEFLIHTGQHYDAEMSELFFQELGLRSPDINLGVGSDSHAAQTAKMLHRLGPILERESPDWVLVYGDTNSTLAASLAASKLHLRTAHVEAGLRSFNRRMPEEINRLVADTLSDLLFAPTQASVDNLLNEGISPARIQLVGDVMLDAALLHARAASEKSRVLEDLDLSDFEYVLVTIHRPENTDCADRLTAIAKGIAEISQERMVVFPAHPRTYQALDSLNLLGVLKDCRLIRPVGYLDMVMLESRAGVIATDSGGVQKEAFFHRRPCVTLRKETEWVELLELGWNRLCDPSDAQAIAKCIRSSLGTHGMDAAPYGIGAAAERIAEALLRA